jgi:hypothetical protein
MSNEEEAAPDTAPTQAQQAPSGSPSDFLKQVVGQQVVVRLNSGVDYRGEWVNLIFLDRDELVYGCRSCDIRRAHVVLLM